jgi:hypothetical protein
MIKKKGKVMKIFEDYGLFILFVSYELRTIKGHALGELVKCQNYQQNWTYLGFLAGFQKP